MYENLKKNDLNSFDSYRGLGILQGLSVGNLGLLYGTSAVQGENGYNKTDFSKSYGVSLNANPARFDVSRGGGRTWKPFIYENVFYGQCSVLFSFSFLLNTMN